ncbi:class I SAM-dependent DNA methyltransferase [Pseudorhodobacter aquimaris]|uniref:class I SAM-dependent DNA methyltransferase n=1 Tax=Pseudorhodobacter aquimaris TaxID=687412 RepID=UPI00067DD2A2|nr:class I SAM-dependent methyltransferase [Pseudorhodobacter aquimaris]
MTKADYDDWAWLYDRTLGPDYCKSKLEALDRMILGHLPVGGRVLDLCCGTGQMLIPIYGRGFLVTGLDISAEMLNYAKENAPVATLMQGDARDFTLPEQVDGVVCASASLNHMRNMDELARVFKSVHSALKEDGIFVFDINHHAQMTRHWVDRPAAGEIAADYAWMITPRYDATSASGAFRVDMYRRPDHARKHGTALSRFLLNRPVLRRFKLAQLAKFGTDHPDWDHRGADYAVYGHDLNAVLSCLDDCGFDARVETITGAEEVGENAAAYFICQRRDDALDLAAAE